MANVVTYNYTGGIQTFTVPNGVNSITATIAGAQGGAGGWTAINGGTAGAGGITSGTINVTPGQILYIVVGGQGSNGIQVTDGYAHYSGTGGGGGGKSWISLSSSFDSNVLLVAGGGGGGGSNGDPNTFPNAYGGAGGYPNGGKGGNNDGSHGEPGAGGGGDGWYGGGGGPSAGSVPVSGGTGGTQSAGGISGGAFGAGGNGGPDGGNATYYGGGCGGAGGGTVGATGQNGLSGSYYIASGGGGGSSYVATSVSNPSIQQGGNSGNGYATISYIATPTISSPTSSNVTQTSATLNANLTSTGSDTCTIGFYWGLNPDSMTNWLPAGTTTSTGIFSASLTGLTSNTPYFYYGYASNSAGNASTSTNDFSTLPTIPAVSTQPVTGPFNVDGAIANGTILSQGQATITSAGVCVSSTNQTPTTSDTIFTTTTTSGAFSIQMTGLTANQTYYVRAYATNAGGTAYGNVVTFITAQPTITSITPNNGANTSVVFIQSITGTNFVSGCTVTLTKTGQSNINGTGFTFTNQNTLSNGSFNITEATAGLWNVVVTNPDGQSSTLFNFNISSYVIGGELIKVQASNYKWATGTLLSAQQSSATRPYINCQIIDKGFREVSEPISSAFGSPLSLEFGNSINAPDGTILTIGRDTNGYLRFGKITDASQSSQWSSLYNATSGIPIASNAIFSNGSATPISAIFPNPAMNPSIAVSDWINGNYVIDIYWWYTDSNANFQIDHARSTDSGNTFVVDYTLPNINIPNSTLCYLWLVAGKPIFDPSTGNVSATVYYLDNYTNYTSSNKASIIKYITSKTGVSASWGTTWTQFPLSLDTQDWNIHSFDVITIPKTGQSFKQGSVSYDGHATYLTFSGYHMTLNNAKNYGLYISRIYNLSGDSTIADNADYWGEAIPIIEIQSNIANNATNFYYPTFSFDGEELELVARGDVVTSVNNNGSATTQTYYFLWSSVDFTNFTYPLQLVDINGKSFPNANLPQTSSFNSSYRLVPQSVKGNFYVLTGTSFVWQFEQMNTIADISNYIISYNINEQVAGTSSISLTIDNSDSKWYGTNPTELGASAIAKGSLIYLKQGYWNANGKAEVVPKNVFYINNISQNISATENQLVITGVDLNYLLQSQTTQYSYTFNGPDMYYDMFNNTSMSYWNISSGNWTQIANPNLSIASNVSQSGAYYPTGLGGVFLPLTSGTPNASPVLNGTTLATLAGYITNKQESAMSICAYIPSAGEVDIYPFFIDSNNYMKISIVGGSSSFTVNVTGNCNGIGTSQAVTYTANQALPANVNSATNKWYPIFIHRKFLQGNAPVYTISIGGSQTSSNNSFYNVINNSLLLTNVTPTSSIYYPPNSAATIAIGTSGTWGTLTANNYTNYGFGSFKFIQYDYSQDIEQLTKKIGTLSNVLYYKAEHKYDFDTSSLTEWYGNAVIKNNCLNVPINGMTFNNTILSDEQIEFDAKVFPTSNNLEYAFDFLFRVPNSGSITNAFAVRFGQHMNSDGTPRSIVSIIYHDGGTGDNNYGGYHIYTSNGFMTYGTSTSYDINAFFDLHIDWTQWHHYAITFNEKWIYVYVDDRMVLSYYIDYTDIPQQTSGSWGFSTNKTTYPAGNTTCSLLVKNVYTPMFWNQINSFIINTGDNFQNDIQSNLATVYGYYFSDLAGRLKLIKLEPTDPVSYYYGSSAPNYQLISQTINSSSSEYVNEVVVIGDGVSATAQDTVSIGKNAVVRTNVITDLKIQTVADAQTRAKQELISADKYGIQPSPKQTINVGSEIFDVINVVDNSTSNSTGLNGNYRIYVQSFNEGGTSNDYTFTFNTGNVLNN
jgi:hypothetical protein